jgi:hypothetical protein
MQAPDRSLDLFAIQYVLIPVELAPDIVHTDDPLGAIRSGRLSDGRVFEPTEVALVDAGVLPDWSPTAAHTQSPHVDTRRLPGSDGEYEVDARDGDCLLVMSEVHYRWWRVSIDSRPATPLRVNYTIVGVVVPRGRHVICLWIEPRSTWIGGAVSGAALLAWIIFTGACFRTNRTT